MNDILRILARGQRLTAAEAEQAMRTILEGQASDVEVASFLMALASRGATTEELTALTRVMRELLMPVACDDPHAIDMCGTGGDGLGTFNISTTASFVCAGAGVTVAKHGNTGVSSRCGSADVLRTLGVNLELNATGVATCLQDVGIGFIFARHFHPAMRFVMPARRALGVPTCFNILGPLCNPAGVRRQVVGAFTLDVAGQMAQILAALQAEHVITVSAKVGMDEFALDGCSPYFEYKRGARAPVRHDFDPNMLGLPEVPVHALRGGDPEGNARILVEVLRGTHGAPRDVVLVNSAFGLYVSGRFGCSLMTCLEAATESIDSGAAARCLDRLCAVSQRL